MKIIYTIAMILLSGIFLFSAAAIFTYYKDARENEKEIEGIIQEVIQEPAEVYGEKHGGTGEQMERVQIDFGRLREINADTAGWIMFPDRCVNYPLVQCDDNSYYLGHSFKRSKNAAGCIFMDCRNESFADQNVVIYGHNMADNTMFGSLKGVFSEEFWEREGSDIIFIFDTGNHLRKYQIFSYYTVEKEDYYITTSFQDDEEYAEFLSKIKARSFRVLNVDVTTDDYILTLSTCAGVSGTGRRRVIHAKLI